MPSSSPPSDLLASILKTSSQIYTTHIAPLLPTDLQRLVFTFASVLTTTIVSAYQLSTQLTSIIIPLITDPSGSINLVSLAALLVVLWISLRVLDFARRSVIGMIVFWIKVGMVVGVIMLGAWVWSVGLEVAVKQAAWVGGALLGGLKGWVEGSTGPNAGVPSGAGYGGARGGKGWSGNDSGKGGAGGGFGWNRRGGGAWI
jgi:hypothetical protein